MSDIRAIQGADWKPCGCLFVESQVDGMNVTGFVCKHRLHERDPLSGQCETIYFPEPLLANHHESVHMVMPDRRLVWLENGVVAVLGYVIAPGVQESALVDALIREVGCTSP